MIVAGVLVGCLILPMVVSGQSENWEELEQELNGQLELLDTELNRVEMEQEQVGEERDVESKSDDDLNTSTDRIFIQQNGGMTEILSEKAVAVNLLNSGEISQVKFSGGNQVIGLTENDDGMVYEVTGVSHQKLFGVWPVEIEKVITVRADTGTIVKQELSFWAKVLDVLAEY